MGPESWKTNLEAKGQDAGEGSVVFLRMICPSKKQIICCKNALSIVDLGRELGAGQGLVGEGGVVPGREAKLRQRLRKQASSTHLSKYKLKAMTELHWRIPGGFPPGKF